MHKDHTHDGPAMFDAGDPALAELRKHTESLASIERKLPDAGVPLTAGSAGIEGRVLLESGAPAAGVALVVYRRAFGGKAARLGQTTTHEDGSYSFAYEAGAKAENLEIRALDAAGKEVSLSRTKVGAEKRGALNLVAPARIAPCAAEYERLTAEIKEHLGEGGKLAAAEETEEQPDLSILAQASGWDARLLALSATAEKLAETTRIPAKALYAIHRTGLPATEELLALSPASKVQEALAKAAAAGIVSLDEAEIKGAMDAFSRFAAMKRRSARAPGAPSTFGELLDAAGLSEKKKQAFERLYFEHAHDGEELFTKAKEATNPEERLTDEEIEKLRHRGKLAHLTVNNLPLINALVASLGGDLRRLAAKDLHTPAAWEREIRGLAGGDGEKLKKLIPPGYGGEKVEERLSAYAADMARKVRISFPTQVLSRLVETGNLSLGERFAAKKGAVKAFLDKAADLGFTPGQQSLSTFVREHRARLFPAGVIDAETVAAVKQVQRLHQITPDDQALAGAAAAGITSAQDVVALPRKAFVERYGRALGSEETADLVYRKAQQVSAVTMEAAASAKLLAGTPMVFALTGDLDFADEAVRENFPTLEQLFHSTDFCACQHCRSVLSPAAYLTDLLRFLEQPVGPSPKVPFEVLSKRRPDIPNLPLTCENTNTALPAIDIVNEILEYWVAAATVEARDTGDAKSEDLIAEPQYVEKAVYDQGGKLQGASYPLSLPFHLPIESMRRLLGRWQVSFADLLITFRQNDDLTSWAPIFAEQLGLTQKEVALYTNGKPLDSWFELYGFTDEAAAKAALDGSAKVIARALDVSYMDLAALSEAWFVNPPSANPLLLLNDKDDPCDFGKTRFVRADGAKAEKMVYLRLNLLARLWKKLGWELGELDGALRSLLPGGAVVLDDKDKIGAALGAAILNLSHLDSLAAQLATGKGGREGRMALLPLWGSIPNALYTRLFLTPAARRADATFDPTKGEKLDKHLPAVQSALGIDAADVDRILTDKGLSLATEKLTFDNLALLYRYAFLVRALGLSVAELIARIHTSGLDPFATPGAVTALADDVLYTRTLGFVKAARALEGRGLAPGEIAYLLSHQFDAVGDYRARAAVPFALLRGLGAEISRIRAEHPSGEGISDEALRRELSLVLPAPAVERFFAFFRGAVVTGARAFFDAWLVAPVGFFAPADANAAFSAMFDPPLGPESDEDAQKRDQKRRNTLAGALIPFVTTRLVQEAILAALTADLGLDPAMVALLLTQATGPLADPSATGQTLLDAFAAAAERGVTATFHANADLTGAITRVTTPSLSTDAKGAPVSPQSAVFTGYLEAPAKGVYTLSIKLQKKDATAALFLGDAADPVLRGKAGKADDELRGSASLPAGALVPFRLVLTDLDGGHASVTVQGEGLGEQPISAFNPVPEEAVTRVQRAWILAHKAARVIQMFGLGARETRYLLAALAAATRTFPTLPGEATEAGAKAIFGILVRIASYVDLRAALGGAEEVVGIFEAARRVYPLGSPPDTATMLKGLYQLVADLLRTDAATVAAAAKQLKYDTDLTITTTSVQEVVAGGFADEAKLSRLMKMVSLTGQLRVPVGTAAKWATTTPSMDIAEEVRGALKGRYDEGAWRRAAQPVFDELRQKKRDALVAYVLAHHPAKIGSADQLFEYFLVDALVEPVVLTSRIRSAISAVQTFVQRCFMNLEPDVAPAALDADLWAWMKRYRVWEANRKIYLYPENYLEPELRDDQSHLYRELTGALLKGDVTHELAEDALFKYLSGLDAIAKLEIVTGYRQTSPGSPPVETLHVIGRTYSLPHKYYYRRREGTMWTPWEPVDLDIEGDHVMAAVWRGRLHLFWLTFLEKGDTSGVSGSTVENVKSLTVSSATPRIIEVQVSFADYFQGTWTGRTSSGYGDPMSAKVTGAFDAQSVGCWMTKHEGAGGDGALLINVGEPFRHAFRILSRNATPTKEVREQGEDLDHSYPPIARRASVYQWSSHKDGLNLYYVERQTSADGEHFSRVSAFTDLALRKGTGYTLVLPGNSAGYAVDTSDGRMFYPLGPIFYQNGRDAFHVDADVHETTSSGFGSFALAPNRAGLLGGSKLAELSLTPFVPARRRPGDPPWEGDPAARFALAGTPDWLVRTGVGVGFKGGVVGARGRVDPADLAGGEVATIAHPGSFKKDR